MVAAAAMAGVPLLNGFLSKEMFFAETLSVESHRAFEWIVPDRGDGRRVVSVAYSLRFIHDVFFNGEPVGPAADAARAAALDARPGRDPGRRSASSWASLPAITVGPLLAVAARRGAGRRAARLQPRALARLQPAAADERDRAGRRRARRTSSLQRTINLHSVTRLPVNGKHVFDACGRRQRGASPSR